MREAHLLDVPQGPSGLVWPSGGWETWLMGKWGLKHSLIMNHELMFISAGDIHTQ